MKLKKIFYDLSQNYNCIRIRSINGHNLKWIEKESTIVRDPNFYVSAGKRWSDLIQLDGRANYAVSDRFRQVLEDNFCRRWNYFPINIINTDQQYHIIYDLFKAGPILNRDGNYFVAEQPTDEELLTQPFESPFRARIFDISTWDGSDMFTLKGTHYDVCTPVVINLLEKHKIKGYHTRPILGVELTPEEKVFYAKKVKAEMDENNRAIEAEIARRID